MKVGDLVRDFGDGDIGIIVSEVRSYPAEVNQKRAYPNGHNYVMVSWPSNNHEPVQMDLLAVKNGWVEIINESR